MLEFLNNIFGITFYESLAKIVYECKHNNFNVFKLIVYISSPLNNINPYPKTTEAQYKGYKISAISKRYTPVL